MPEMTVLIPTYNRLTALVATLSALAFQSYKPFKIFIADQSDEPIVCSLHFQSIVRFLEHKGITVCVKPNLPRRGIAHQSQFLLDQVDTPYCLFLGDDVLLEPFALRNMIETLKREGCGFVGNAVIGLSYKADERPHQQHIELWNGPVQPEYITPASKAWERYQLHNAANLWHVQEKLGVTPDNPQTYKVAWVGGCVMFDTAKLRDVGGFSFWTELPPQHAGEDVLVQLRVMKKYGGCGVMPSGAYHQELPTTIPQSERKVDAPKCLAI
ncbi:MAG TPA: glycosyltransferase family 2 protein [Candidatus Limnocylindrales bacterium]|nr:glycosyltransferase family 2 protein [Candidatus Limnocylindrales bacterium]